MSPGQDLDGEDDPTAECGEKRFSECGRTFCLVVKATGCYEAADLSKRWVRIRCKVPLVPSRPCLGRKV